MKIAIEAQRIFRKNKHGMDFVALESIRELQKIDKENEYFILVRPGEDDYVLSETSNFKIIKINCPSYALWEQVALPLTLIKLNPDILHCTSNTGPVFCKTPLVLTLHDIIFMEKRQGGNKSLYQNLGWYYRKFIVPKIIENCKRIITVSHYEAARIRDYLKVDNDKVSVVYNGYSIHFKPLANYLAITQKYISHKKFLFFLGNTDPKKNSKKVILGYSRYLKLSGNPLHLLIADFKEEALDTILKEEKIEHIKKYISLSGYIKNSDLPFVYSGARIFLYPSLRESFGIPLLEAMACGTPVITSNTSAIPEVAGEGSVLINPGNEDEIGEMIYKLDSDEEFYNKQIEYGLKRVKNFSWRKSAEELLLIYKSVYNAIS